MIGRRGLLKGAAGMVTWGDPAQRDPRMAGRGGNPPMRPDQAAALSRSRAGSGPAPQSVFVVAQRVIVFGANGGVFVYSPKPAAGNLIASIAPQAGTDPFGNAYVKGDGVYNPGAGAGAQLINDALQFLRGPVGGAGPWTVNTSVSTGGGGTTGLMQISAANTLKLLSAQTGIAASAFTAVTTALAEVQGNLALTDIATPATPPSGASEFFSAAGTPRVIRPSGYTGSLSSGLTDTTDRTVTQAASTQLGGQFTIPANDAAVGTVYRYRCGGTGVWGSTQQQLTLVQLLAGANVNQSNIAATSFAVSDPFDWDLWLEIAVKTTGAGGTCNCRLAVDISKNNAASGTNLTQVRRAAAVAFNTTIANTLQLNALWASTTGAPTITGNYSTFERIGP